jgi:hypothetical protein
VKYTLQIYNASLYADNEHIPSTPRKSTLPNPYAPPAHVTNLAAAVQYVTLADGSKEARINISFDEPTGDDAIFYKNTLILYSTDNWSTQTVFGAFPDGDAVPPIVTRVTGDTFYIKAISVSVRDKTADTSTAPETSVTVSGAIDGPTADHVSETATRKWAGQKFRIVSKGNSSSSQPANPGLYDEDGTVLKAALRSYNVSVYNRDTDSWDSHTTYDVFGDAANATAMASSLNALGSDKIVVICTNDEPQTNRLTNGLDTAMYRCGASKPIYGSSNFKYRGAYILVGIPGVGQGNGLEFYSGDVDSDPDAWVDTSIEIKNGIVQLGGISVRNAVDISYADGTLVEDLQPAESGADVTGANTAAAITGQGSLATLDQVGDSEITGVSVNKLIAGSIISKLITLALSPGQGDVAIRAGKTDFNNAVAGFILGIDDSDNDRAKLYIGGPTTYLNWDGLGLIIRGEITYMSSSGVQGYNLQAYAPGNLTLQSSDVLEEVTATADYVKVKEFGMPRGGTLRTYFEMKGTGAYYIYAYIARNGTKVGVLRQTYVFNFVAYTEDISGWSPGDTMELWAKRQSGGGNTYVQNFRMKCSFYTKEMGLS